MIDDWLSALASRTPAPGGGAAAALGAATAAALVGMVANYTTGERFLDRSEEMEAITEEAARLRSQALDLAAADAAAFGKVGHAYALARETVAEQEKRAQAIQEALIGAAGPPTEVATTAQEVLVLAEGLVESGNPNVISDVAVAASLARAAIESALVNIEINQALIDSAEVKDRLGRTISDFEASLALAESTVGRVREKLQSQ
jgi:formiminotetrahydrofolate cyclodeaminase